VVNFSFPKSAMDWKIEDIDQLINLRDIEGINFDFKSKNFHEGKGLAKHICAMANVVGGYIILGIEEDKDIHQRLIGFRKDGFLLGEEDKVKNDIFNFVSKIEPFPEVETHTIQNNDNKTFYYVIKIFAEDNKKPYFDKNKHICYIRLGNESLPADRLIILNLYSKYEEKRKEFFYLKVAIDQLKENFNQTIYEINQFDEEFHLSKRDVLAYIDTKLVKEQIAKVDWKLIGDTRFLLGNTHSMEGFQLIGLYHYVNKIEKINLFIQKFNNLESISDKFKIIEILKQSPYYFGQNGQGTKEIIGQLDSLSTKIDNLLNKNVGI
jgi:Putative DNA-binding domain